MSTVIVFGWWDYKFYFLLLLYTFHAIRMFTFFLFKKIYFFKGIYSYTTKRIFCDLKEVITQKNP